MSSRSSLTITRRESVLQERPILQTVLFDITRRKPVLQGESILRSDVFDRYPQLAGFAGYIDTAV